MRLSHYSYIQREDIPHGKVILVGMMEDGPTGTPFILKENGSATFLLGDNEVSRTYNLLVRKGVPVEDIILFRLNGVPAQSEIVVNDEVVFRLQTLTSHNEDQHIEFTISEKGVALISNFSDEAIEEGRRKDFIRTYLFEDYTTLSELAQGITADAALGLHNVIAEQVKHLPSESLTQQLGPRAFLYGSSEESLVISDGNFPEGSIESEHSFLYDYWERFYFHLLGSDFDGESASKILDIAAEVIYFPDAPIDELPELAILAGRVAEQKTESQDVLCTSLFRTTLLPKERILEDDEYMNDDGTFYNDDTKENEIWAPKLEQDLFINKLTNLFTEEEKSYSEMNHVQIVVGEEFTSQGNIIPGAAHHLVHLINQELNSTTNKELAQFERINATLDKKQIDKLSAKGYICIVDSIRRNAVTSKVKTPYNINSLKDEFYYKKILSYIMYDIKLMLDKYIGESISIYESARIENLLNEYLLQYQDDRLIESFNLGERVVDALNQSSSIDINIVLYGVVEKIKGSVQLNEQGWEVDLWSI